MNDCSKYRAIHPANNILIVPERMYLRKICNNLPNPLITCIRLTQFLPYFFRKSSIIKVILVISTRKEIRTTQYQFYILLLY